ncbi:hypothetical protein A374_00360 [Fictibacillus macauensis ZFHKF-1]|uniref:Aminoglycoside phosphotransferase domain-containing protein n=1 Tax=Fictibacillus macauensis ZFHKF-1 TaxID=1196324 RepID=I8UKH5_9BACL|nr:hypothetical protein [Fictibacillus macauensis]EIT87380.1 hypothetical protein A374_00360 [Fictibacillus macauensis ZFHKF-1]
MSPQQIVSDWIKGEVKLVPHSSPHTHYTGYSERYNQQVFIKVLYNKSKYEAEVETGQSYVQSPFIHGLEVQRTRSETPLYMIISQHLPLVEVTAMNESVMKEAAQLVKTFHHSAQRSLDNDDLSIIKRLEKEVTKHSYEEKVIQLYSLFTPHIAKIDHEYRRLPKVTIHGDLGFRNMYSVNKKLVLIDYEQARPGITWEDFTKFFHRELRNGTLEDAFLTEYGREHEPSDALKHLLYYIEALGIIRYTASFYDEAFANLGEELLHKVKIFLT